MGWLRSLIGLVVIVAVVAFGVLFSLANDSQLSVDLLLWQLPEQSAALWLVLAFLLGGLLGMASGMAAVLRLRASKLRLQAKIKKLEAQRR